MACRDVDSWCACAMHLLNEIRANKLYMHIWGLLWKRLNQQEIFFSIVPHILMRFEMNAQIILIRKKLRTDKAFRKKLRIWYFCGRTRISGGDGSTRYGRFLRCIVRVIQKIFHARSFHRIFVVEKSRCGLKRCWWHRIACAWRRLFFYYWHLTEVIEEAFSWAWRRRTWRWSRTCTETKTFGNLVDLFQTRRFHALLLQHSVFLVKLIDEISTLLLNTAAVRSVRTFIELRWLRRMLGYLREHGREGKAIRREV